MMICASLWKRNYQPLADITVPNKSKYADKHGYSKYFVTLNDNADLMFVKINVILQAMELIQEGDWVWFSDCDGVVTNFGKRLEDLADNRYGIVVSEDFNGINSGSILARKTPRVKEYLEFILSSPDRANCEQNTMIKELKNPRWDGIIKFIDQNLLNSYDYSLPNIAACGKVTPEVLEKGQWKPGDFFIHFPATTLQKRLELCAKYDREAM